MGSNSQETYRPWQPMEDLPKTRYCEAVHDDWEFFRILLRPEDPTRPMLRLLFDAVIGYRNVNESYRLRLLDDRKAMQNRGTLFVVDHSNWLRWLSEESHGVVEHMHGNPVHYAILTPEDCIDVASAYPPEVEWLS